MKIKNRLAGLMVAALMFTSTPIFAADWNGPSVVIDALFVYPTYVVVAQASYTGTAGCRADGWGFYWNDFDAPTQQRIYAALLAARLTQTPIKPIFTDTGCGPENLKKFTGLFML